MTGSPRAPIRPPLKIRVTPRAKQARIIVDESPDGSVLYKIYVTVPAEDGKANDAVIAALAKYLDVPKTSLRIVKGLTSRDKVVTLI